MRVREDFRRPLLRALLPWILFAILLGLYSWGSYQRHRENPKDKLIPNYLQLAKGIEQVTRVRKSTGQRWIVQDIEASVTRLAIGLGLSAFVGISIGLHMGAFPAVEVFFTRFINFISFVPPLALLPLVFIYLGVEDTAKVALIFLGTVFTLTEGVYLAVKQVPQRFIQQAYAQGASTFEVLFKICLKYKLPEILDTVRLALRPAWVYLIAAELIAADAGLGYRIQLVGRQLGVHIIIPYLLIIALLGFLMDLGLRVLNRVLHPWSLVR